MEDGEVVIGDKKEEENERERETLPDWAEWLRHETEDGAITWIRDLSGDTWRENAGGPLVFKQLRKPHKRPRSFNNTKQLW